MLSHGTKRNDLSDLELPAPLLLKRFPDLKYLDEPRWRGGQLTKDLIRELQPDLEAIVSGHGLSFFRQNFELVSPETMYGVAAFGGFPKRMRDWRFGFQFEQGYASYQHGLSRIYELVINNDPCHAYLMNTNPLGAQKLVMAHVYAHNDFFKENFYFKNTNRNMLNEMANHASRVDAFIQKHGLEEVEKFIDQCRSIEDLIDPSSLGIVRYKAPSRAFENEDKKEEVPNFRLKVEPYMENFVNPSSLIKAEEERWKEAQKNKEKRNPEEPDRDVIHYLLEHAPLKEWQRAILEMIREEAYYFAPQGETKVLNEGWATYWHRVIMAGSLSRSHDIIDSAEDTSGTLASPGFNPYRVGLSLLEDVEYRYSHFMDGKEWEECDDLEERNSWAKKHFDPERGLRELFRVRQVHNDLTFIDEFLTPEFCKRAKLFTAEYRKSVDGYVVEPREFQRIKAELLNARTNGGKPRFVVEDGNFRNRKELLLKHKFEGVELDLNKAEGTMRNLASIWNRPVHVETVIDDEKSLLSMEDGKFRQEEI